MNRILVVNSDFHVPLAVRAGLWGSGHISDQEFQDHDGGVEFLDNHRDGLARVASADPHPLDVALVEWGPSVRSGGTGVRTAPEILKAYVAAAQPLGVRVIVLSTYVVDEDLNATAVPMGAAALIKMPFSPLEVGETIERVLLG